MPGGSKATGFCHQARCVSPSRA
nr:ATP:cob(I)alamin adenosyltransferase [Simiduia aestuariiviva]